MLNTCICYMSMLMSIALTRSLGVHVHSCLPNTYGKTCSSASSVCASANPCLHGGHCVESSGMTMCQCTNGENRQLYFLLKCIQSSICIFNSDVFYLRFEDCKYLCGQYPWRQGPDMVNTNYRNLSVVLPCVPSDINPLILIWF